MPRLTQSEFERLTQEVPLIQLTFDEIDRLRRSRRCSDMLFVALNRTLIQRGYGSGDCVDERRFQQEVRRWRRGVAELGRQLRLCAEMNEIQAAEEIYCFVNEEGKYLNASGTDWNWVNLQEADNLFVLTGATDFDSEISGVRSSFPEHQISMVRFVLVPGVVL